VVQPDEVKASDQLELSGVGVLYGVGIMDRQPREKRLDIVVFDVVEPVGSEMKAAPGHWLLLTAVAGLALDGPGEPRQDTGCCSPVSVGRPQHLRA